MQNTKEKVERFNKKLGYKLEIEQTREKLKKFQKKLAKEIALHDYVTTKFIKEGNRDASLHENLSAKVLVLKMLFDDIFEKELKERGK